MTTDTALTEVAEKDVVYTKSYETNEVASLSINFACICSLDSEFLVKLTAKNPLLHLETEGTTILLVKNMPNHENNQKNLTRLLIKLGIWNESKNNEKGELYDSGGSIAFDDGSVKMPDITYILRQRLEGQPKNQVILLVPDFVVEYLSTYDSLREAKEKMQFYMNKGVLLGWLIVPKEQITYIYKPDCEVASKKFEEELSGENVLPSFTIVLASIFE
jgi:Uma2 family endonuclease